MYAFAPLDISSLFSMERARKNRRQKDKKRRGPVGMRDGVHQSGRRDADCKVPAKS